MKSPIFEGNWEFNIRAVYRGKDKSVDETQLFFHWDYFNERIKSIYPSEVNRVGFFFIGISNIDAAGRIGAAIDEGFKNSAAETLTETEKAFNMEFVSMSEEILQMIQIVSFFILVIILAVVANTMAMAGRERSGEFATMKVLGGLLGVALTFPVCHLIGSSLANFLPVFSPPTTVVLLDIAAIFLIAAFASAQPIVRVLRLSVAGGLRHV